MSLTLKRGFIRLFLTMIILWNVAVVWYVVKSASENRSSTVSMYLETERLCAQSRPFKECWAEYKKATGGYSLWTDVRREFRPVNVIAIELLPVVVLGICAGFIWILVRTVLWILHGFGIEIKRPIFSGESISFLAMFGRTGRWLIVPKNIVALAFFVGGLSVAYYFTVSLPNSNREKLQFEKSRLEAEKEERDKKEEAAKQAALDRQSSFQTCSFDAGTSYWQYIKLNGKETLGKPGVYNAPLYVWTAADKKKSEEIAECHRQYDK